MTLSVLSICISLPFGLMKDTYVGMQKGEGDRRWERGTGVEIGREEGEGGRERRWREGRKRGRDGGSEEAREHL